ncbi:pyridoxamine 5'-phosphate oxidase family protein [Proteiniborus sp. MB09-C3]|uniref:pyridoxamine 5'-phosphate oxidase family protein n=1 Tax=Proteiniborus sp. MB09-C3 TaxID=3050072 RepID=UPI002555E6B8|nr:pyridoxamine 5'-phosphate oxidase family protein [Proteiniborus sp. MB09-C3]WIV11438.1 pyridoxamine 5'-phosphate oxidase family protein [Proteiniborus sp. MB09-C3]
MDKRLNTAELKHNIKQFLDENNLASLATCGNNIPRCSPVQYFTGDNMDIYVISSGGDKFNNIQDNPNVCLLVNTEYLDYKKIKGVQVFGQAHTSLKHSDLVDEAKKHAPYEQLLAIEKDWINIIKIIPDEIVYLDALNGDRTKQILKNDQVIEKQDRVLSMH